MTWKNEPQRHYMAAKGIKTITNNAYVRKQLVENEKNYFADMLLKKLSKALNKQMKELEREVSIGNTYREDDDTEQEINGYLVGLYYSPTKNLYLANFNVNEAESYYSHVIFKFDITTGKIEILKSKVEWAIPSSQYSFNKTNAGEYLKSDTYEISFLNGR